MTHKLKKRTKFQERIGLPALPEQHLVEERPVVFKGRAVLPAREDPALAARQAEERRREDVGVLEETRIQQEIEEKAPVLGAVEEEFAKPLPGAEEVGIIGFVKRAFDKITRADLSEEERAAEFKTLGESLLLGAAPGGRIVKVGKGLTIPVSNAIAARGAATKKIVKDSTDRITQAGLLARLWQTKVGKVIIVGGVTQPFIEGYASALDAANMQMKEGISEGIISTMNKGGYGEGTSGALVAARMVRQIESNVNANESTIKLLGIFSLRALFLAKFEPIFARIGKIRIEFDEAKINIKLYAANPIPIQQEQLGLVADELGGS